LISPYFFIFGVKNTRVLLTLGIKIPGRYTFRAQKYPAKNSSRAEFKLKLKTKELPFASGRTNAHLLQLYANHKSSSFIIIYIYYIILTTQVQYQNAFHPCNQPKKPTAGHFMAGGSITA
jgi:hypothetical protein